MFKEQQNNNQDNEFRVVQLPTTVKRAVKTHIIKGAQGVLDTAAALNQKIGKVPFKGHNQEVFNHLLQGISDHFVAKHGNTPSAPRAG